MLALLKDLWNDERGFVVTAELALMATLGVVGATVGLYSAGKAVDEELRDVARAFRSLDQSYYVKGHAGCGAATAGSAYKQPSVKRSLERLERDERDFERGERRDDERERRRRFDHRPEDRRRFDRGRDRRSDNRRDDRQEEPRPANRDERPERRE